jgi:hypothetical protein
LDYSAKDETATPSPLTMEKIEGLLQQLDDRGQLLLTPLVF